jgi:hypothetical protein
MNAVNQGNIVSLCEAPGTTFKYGLGLLQQKKGINHVIVPKSGIDKPEQYISALIRDFLKT